MAGVVGVAAETAAPSQGLCLRAQSLGRIGKLTSVTRFSRFLENRSTYEISDNSIGKLVRFRV